MRMRVRARDVMLAKCAEAGLETSTVDLAGMKIEPCDVCEGCKSGNGCAKDDDARRVMGLMEKADAIYRSVLTPEQYAKLQALQKAEPKVATEKKH